MSDRILPVWRRYLPTMIKAGGSLALLGFLVWMLDFEDALSQMRRVEPVAVVLAVLALTGQAVTAAWRWGWLNQRGGIHLSISQTLRILYVGLLFNQVLPSAIGGDALRVILLARSGVTRVSGAVTSILADRALGITALVGSAIVGVPALVAADALPPAAELTFWALSLGAWGGMIWLVVFRGWLPIPERFPEKLRLPMIKLRQVFSDRMAGVGLIAGSILVHIWTIAAVLALAWGLGLEIPPLALVAVLPPVFLVMAIPVSFAGWGVREAALITALAIFGVSASAALALSILFGIATIIAALPGALVLWARPDRREVLEAEGV